MKITTQVVETQVYTVEVELSDGWAFNEQAIKSLSFNAVHHDQGRGKVVNEDHESTCQILLGEEKQ